MARRIEELKPAWVHAMHDATIAGEALPYYTNALLEPQFASEAGSSGYRSPPNAFRSASDT